MGSHILSDALYPCNNAQNPWVNVITPLLLSLLAIVRFSNKHWLRFFSSQCNHLSSIGLKVIPLIFSFRWRNISEKLTNTKPLNERLRKDWLPWNEVHQPWSGSRVQPIKPFFTSQDSLLHFSFFFSWKMQ